MITVPSDYNGAANPDDPVTVQHDAFLTRVRACVCVGGGGADANEPATLQVHESAARTLAVGGCAI